jgi:predicted DNA-binding transcriptional regulator YafY
VDAWGLTLRNGTAYLIGWDHDRRARRTFRLSRVTSTLRTVTTDESAPVPPEFDAAEVLARAHGDGTDVVVAVRATAVPDLELRGGRVVADEEVGRAVPDGWRAGVLAEADATRLRGWLLGSADRVVVLDPTWLRDEVVAQLRAMADAGDAP